jgi:N-methylhydantoinase A/oxoprolinase/acetone carboxylase beta subunit
MDASVHARADLVPGDVVPGPAVVEERDTTIVLLPDWTATVADDLSLVAVRERADQSTLALQETAVDAR